MFSMQSLISETDTWYGLLERGAEEAQESIHALIRVLRNPQEKHSLSAFVETRRNEKRIANELTEELLTTFLTPFERQDVQGISEALYRIAKSAEKFAERFLIAQRHTGEVDFSEHVVLLESAANLVVGSVKELRRGVSLKHAKTFNDRLQQIESDADQLMLDAIRDLYLRDHSAVRVIVLKDLYQFLERIFDRCRDVGSIVFNLSVKYSA
jgi:uncharacterized protein Yka (UPF0111/DUF47 family)